MIEGAIFDMDGLMLDTQKVWDKVSVENGAANGLVVTQEYLDEIRGSSIEAILDIMRRYFGPECDVKDVMRQAIVRAEAAFAQPIDKKPGLVELLDWLKGHGIPIAVASGSPVQFIERNTRNAGIDGYFDLLLSGDEAAHAKPEPDVFLIAAERLGTDPKCTLVFEDSGNGIKAAAAGGFIPVLVPDVEHITDEVVNLAAAVCGTLADVIPLLESGELEAR